MIFFLMFELTDTLVNGHTARLRSNMTLWAANTTRLGIIWLILPGGAFSTSIAAYVTTGGAVG